MENLYHESSRSVKVEGPRAVETRWLRNLVSVVSQALIDPVDLFFGFLNESNVKSGRILCFGSAGRPK